MELSIFVAQIMSLAYLSVGIAALRGKFDFHKMVQDFAKSPGLVYLAGIVTLIIGMLLIKNHNFWVKDWTVIITILGWAATVKGVLLIAFPEFMNLFKNMFKSSKSLGFFVLIFGLMFGYFGFMA